MKGSLWSLEWRLALRRRRLFVLNVAIPLLLVVPIAVGGAPAFHAAAAYTILFVLFGTFGSAIPLLREGEAGLLGRIVLAGHPEARILVERTLANAALDTLQLLPAFGVVLGLGGAPGPVWALAVPVLAGALLAANATGVLVAAAARSLAEGALFAAVVALFLLHGSGVFRTAPPGSAGAALEAVLPFGPLHETVLAGAGGPALSSGLPALFLAPWAGAAVLVLSCAAGARPLLRRIARGGG